VLHKFSFLIIEGHIFVERKLLYLAWKTYSWFSEFSWYILEFNFLITQVLNPRERERDQKKWSINQNCHHIIITLQTNGGVGVDAIAIIKRRIKPSSN